MPKGNSNGGNRRIKALAFLMICLCLGVLPHFMPSHQAFLPAIVVGIVVGGYGLFVVLKGQRIVDTLNSIPILDKDLPTIDILISARDEEAVIQRLVDRLLLIKYPENKLKITIIDDGSNDNTANLLRESSQNATNIQVLNRPRFSKGGKSGALNYGLKLIKGDWIFILDADAQFQDDVLLKIAPTLVARKCDALQLRKAVSNPKQNLLTTCQAMEMAMDAVIQQGRFYSGGVTELRGNGQFIKRSVLDKCGGFNEDTVTDDLDLSFRFLINSASIGIIWDPPIAEEGVENLYSLWKQRQRWSEGGLQRFFDYFPHLISNNLTISKRIDLLCFFILQYLLPVVSFVDVIYSIVSRTVPIIWPLSIIALAISSFAYYAGCRKRSYGPPIPSPKLFHIFIATVYLMHWFVVIPFITLKMSFLPKKLVWVKTNHFGVTKE